MKWNLRTSTMNEDVNYFPSAKRAKREKSFVKEQRPITFKSLDQKRNDKLENELKSIKEENGKIKTENDDLKRCMDILNEKAEEKNERIRHLESELQDIKEENCKIKTESDSLKHCYENLNVELSESRKRNQLLMSSTSSSEREAGSSTIVVEGVEGHSSPTPSGEGEAGSLNIVVEDVEGHSSPTPSGEGAARSPIIVEKDVEVNSLNEGRSSFTGIKIFEIKKYDEVNNQVKKNKEAAKELVKLFEENIFEETIKDYITESMKLLFTRHFFLNHTSFKHEKDKVCVKYTKILQCFMGSIKNKFKEEEIAEEVNGNLLKFIKDTIYDFKQAVRASPYLWVE